MGSFEGLARAATPRTAVPAHPNLPCGTEEWLQRSQSFETTDYRALETAFNELNDYLTLRTHVDGYSLSEADLAVWTNIRGNSTARPLLSRMTNVARWYEYIEETRPLVTRFSPEPSGYLHVGHAKAALLNDQFAHRSPGGRLICRFDDTNPSKAKKEFQDSILDDLALMKIKPDTISDSSDYFQDMHDYAVRLIKQGKAFAEDAKLGKKDTDRQNGRPSKRRDMSIDETLQHFCEMKTGSDEGRRWCLRARMTHDHKNGALRDPVIYRCNVTPHHRTGTTWQIYPTYDFSVPILDSIEGVTLALRTTEYSDRDPSYKWFQDVLGLRSVEIREFSRLTFVQTVLSKRKLANIVDKGAVTGWDDPRMPTIRGTHRCGMTIPALRNFILQQGPSRNVVNLEWGAIWALNKKKIGPKAPRHTAIAQRQAVRCTIQGLSDMTEETRPKFAKRAGNADLGQKQVVFGPQILVEQVDALAFAQDEEITLMNWGNAFVRSICRDDTDTVNAVDLQLHLDGDVKQTSKKVTGLAATDKNQIPVDLVTFDHLICKDKLDKGDNVEEFLTPVTKFVEESFADCNIADLPPGTIVQFDRKGWYKLDDKISGIDSNLTFFKIPTK